MRRVDSGDGRAVLVVIEGIGSYGSLLSEQVMAAGLLVAEPGPHPESRRSDRTAGPGPIQPVSAVAG
jgi:hypothetical protein